MPENSSLDAPEGWRLPVRFPKIQDQNRGDEREDLAWNRHAHDWRHHDRGQERHAQTPERHAKDEKRSFKWQDRAFEEIEDQQSPESKPKHKTHDSDQDEMRGSINNGGGGQGIAGGSPKEESRGEKRISSSESSLGKFGPEESLSHLKGFMAMEDAAQAKRVKNEKADFNSWGTKYNAQFTTWGSPKGFDRPSGGGRGGRGLGLGGKEAISQKHRERTDTGGAHESAASRHRTRMALFGGF